MTHWVDHHGDPLNTTRPSALHPMEHQVDHQGGPPNIPYPIGQRTLPCAPSRPAPRALAPDPRADAPMELRISRAPPKHPQKVVMNKTFSSPGFYSYLAQSIFEVVLIQ